MEGMKGMKGVIICSEISIFRFNLWIKCLLVAVFRIRYETKSIVDFLFHSTSVIMRPE
jgi:hypothetical protein